MTPGGRREYVNC